MQRTYRPPPGFYDLPFTWVFEASGLTDGSNALNQQVYVEGGLGDFWLRRVAGLGSVVAPGAGKFQIRRASAEFLESEPVFASTIGKDDLPVIPEEKYPETSNIRFDLYDVLRNDPINFGPVQELNSSPATGNYYAISVSIDPIGGATMVVGNAGGIVGGIAQGVAYVYNLINGTWTLAATLTAPDGLAGDLFGESVAIYNGTIVVGSPDATVSANALAGKSYIFTGSGSTWTLQQEIVNPNPSVNDKFGSAIAINGNTAFISGGANTLGVCVFNRSGAVWTLAQRLLIGIAIGSFSLPTGANQISLSPTVAVVGEPSGNANKGQAHIFTLSGGTWTDVQEITASDGANGDSFGRTVSIDLAGTNILVGAPVHGVGGAVYAFKLSGGSWTQFQEIIPSDVAGSDEFGQAVNINGTNAFIGSVLHGVGGAVYYYALELGVWTFIQEFVPSDTVPAAEFGGAVALVGSTAAIGAPAHAFGGGIIGAVYIFAGPSVFKSQLAFQGVRRQKGPEPKVIQDYKYTAKSFTYTQQVTLTVPGPSQSPSIRLFQTIDDYDFDLLQLIITYKSAQALPAVVTALQLYDYAKRFTSNIPMLDIFLNGAPGSEYGNGAIVPPLSYPQETQIQLDIYSLATTLALPITITVHFVGIQRYPCA